MIGEGDLFYETSASLFCLRGARLPARARPVCGVCAGGGAQHLYDRRGVRGRYAHGGDDFRLLQRYGRGTGGTSVQPLRQRLPRRGGVCARVQKFCGVRLLRGGKLRGDAHFLRFALRGMGGVRRGRERAARAARLARTRGRAVRNFGGVYAHARERRSPHGRDGAYRQPRQFLSRAVRVGSGERLPRMRVRLERRPLLQRLRRLRRFSDRARLVYGGVVGDGRGGGGERRAQAVRNGAGKRARLRRCIERRIFRRTAHGGGDDRPVLLL